MYSNFGNSDLTPMIAWQNSVDAYQRFRQSFRGKKHEKKMPNGKTNRVPGRSHWPEPDSIRDLTNFALEPKVPAPTTVDADLDPHDHRRRIVIQDQEKPNFPRAVLGLPIVFHFSDGPERMTAAIKVPDPADVELRPRALNTDGTPKSDAKGRPVTLDRMGSPVITKPRKLNGVWHAVVLILPTEQSCQCHAY